MFVNLKKIIQQWIVRCALKPLKYICIRKIFPKLEFNVIKNTYYDILNRNLEDYLYAPRKNKYLKIKCFIQSPFCTFYKPK